MLATFTIPFLIGAAIGLAAGTLIGATIVTRLYRQRLHKLEHRQHQFEQLLAGHPDFHWPTPANGNGVGTPEQKTEAA